MPETEGPGLARSGQRATSPAALERDKEAKTQAALRETEQTKRYGESFFSPCCSTHTESSKPARECVGSVAALGDPWRLRRRLSLMRGLSRVLWSAGNDPPLQPSRLPRLSSRARVPAGRGRRGSGRHGGWRLVAFLFRNARRRLPRASGQELAALQTTSF